MSLTFCLSFRNVSNTVVIVSYTGFFVSYFYRWICSFRSSKILQTIVISRSLLGQTTSLEAFLGLSLMKLCKLYCRLRLVRQCVPRIISFLFKIMRYFDNFMQKVLPFLKQHSLQYGSIGIFSYRLQAHPLLLNTTLFMGKICKENNQPISNKLVCMNEPS